MGLSFHILQVGPFVYKAVTVKDSVDYKTGHVNLQYDEDGETLTYRPRWGETELSIINFYQQEILHH